MTRYVIDAPTLLHIVANGIQPSPEHQIVAPNLIRSQALSLPFEAVLNGDLTEDLALQHHRRLTELKIQLVTLAGYGMSDFVSHERSYGRVHSPQESDTV